MKTYPADVSGMGEGGEAPGEAQSSKFKAQGKGQGPGSSVTWAHLREERGVHAAESHGCNRGFTTSLAVAPFCGLKAALLIGPRIPRQRPFWFLSLVSGMGAGGEAQSSKFKAQGKGQGPGSSVTWAHLREERGVHAAESHGCNRGFTTSLAVAPFCGLKAALLIKLRKPLRRPFGSWRLEFPLSFELLSLSFFPAP